MLEFDDIQHILVTRVPALAGRYDFFFQAEDGIRDLTVTGVQTCALPISGITACPAANAVVSAAIGRANCNLGITRTRNNGGYSGYDGLQTEFRANNLFKQLTIRSSFT